MARFTIRELDALDIGAVHALNDIDDLSVELTTGVEQRENMVAAHVAWVSTLDAETLASADWSSGQRSNFDLYIELRSNDIHFERAAAENTFTLGDVESMTDEAIMAIANHGGIDLVVDDAHRDEMLRAHAAWVGTLDMDIQEAYVGDQSGRSNWELYSEIRINGVSIHPSMHATTAYSPSMTM